MVAAKTMAPRRWPKRRSAPPKPWDDKRRSPLRTGHLLQYLPGLAAHGVDVAGLDTAALGEVGPAAAAQAEALHDLGGGGLRGHRGRGRRDHGHPALVDGGGDEDERPLAVL